MGQHFPLAPAPVQIQERVEHLSHLEFPGASAFGGTGRWHQGRKNYPLGIRQIPRIRFALFVLLRHSYSLSCRVSVVSPFYHSCLQNQFPESLSLVLSLVLGHLSWDWPGNVQLRARLRTNEEGTKRCEWTTGRTSSVESVCY